jgi:cytochrome c-type biogenesis protein CcmH
MKDATQSQIEEALTCQCGCGLTVHSCNHVQCPSGIPLKEEIAVQLAAGKNKAEVLTYFSTKYGEKILSAPTTTGFNLVAWVTPFAAVAVAAGLVVIVSRRWKRIATPASAAPRPPADLDAERRARLQAELDRFDA